jgi:ribosomal RNA small subunit methyltransferase A
VIDTHAHLDACADPADALVARARKAGVGRILTVGTTPAGCVEALRYADAFWEVWAILGIHPHEAGQAVGVEGLRPLLEHSRAVAVGETGLDFYRDYAPRERQLELFERHLELAAEVGKPVVVHSRAADEATAQGLERFEGTVVLHCFSSPGLLPAALERGYYVSFAGNVTYPGANDLRAAAAGVPADRLLAETDSPYLAPQPRPERAGERRPHGRRARRRPRRTRRRARSPHRRQRREGILADVSVAPKKQLGQHFLVDENVLGVIGRLAELDRTDVVFEVGPGRGVLTRYLAERVERVHAVELDRSLEPYLEQRLSGLANVTLRFEDALALAPSSLQPPPTKLVSNLPYNVATPVIVESLDGYPSLERWCVMVQREVADRLFARPSTKEYGAVSVLVALVAERTSSHRVSRTAFRPRPNVDSALVAFRRTGLPGSYADVKRVVVAAFAHRRKTLANSLELTGTATRDHATSALNEVGLPPDVRAEALAADDFVRLTAALP